MTRDLGASSPCRPVLRRALLGWGPLKRPVDHLETAVRLVVAAGIALGVLTGILVGGPVTSRVLALQQERQAATVVVTALVDRPPVVVVTGPVSRGASAHATWTDPTDPRVLHHEVVAVPSDTNLGDSVPVWVSTTTGGPTSDPAAMTPPAVVGASAGLGAGLLVVAAVAAPSWGALRGLDRFRSRAWAADWARTEPLWRTRRP